MNKGFYINRLIVNGSDREDVFITFSPNVHVIVGPSNTGKTHIFQCVKYMLGADSQPKPIKESEGYENCYLEIVLPDSTKHTLVRGLSGGHASLYECPYEEIKNYLREPEILYVGKPKKNAITLSEYFLRLSNLNNKKVRRNQSGITDPLYFSDLRHLTLIDEVAIIKEGSPIFTGQRGEDTKEKSVLRLLLTGKDDSNVISKPKKNVIENRKGRMEVIAELIKNYKKELASFNYPEIDSDELDDQIKKLEASIESSKELLDSLYDQAKEYESTIDLHWVEWKENESRLITINELLSRFYLLEKHYDTDISRLDAIQEVGNAFSLLNISQCPVCNGEISDGDHAICSTDDIINASRAELLKIETLKKELYSTTSTLKSEKEFLVETIEKNKKFHAEAQKYATDFVSENIRVMVKKLEDYRGALSEKNAIQKIIEKLEDLEDQKKLYEQEVDPMDGNYSFDELTTSTVTDLCDVVKGLLNEWKYDDVLSVSFSEKTCDLVINGYDRNLSGKGYRALAYAAFSIGLMHICLQPGRNHSGVTLLDSPLCTLRSRHLEKERNLQEKDVIGDKTKEAFYLGISKLKEKGQIIILENDGPAHPQDLNIGYTEFTKDANVGRYGFYPKSDALIKA
ncbi:AAA family ATPase [Flavobacterium sp.]|uniref:AAA family ATPase n=1 Tax=Flavobacterium sp. TaxID=239 RepID=UPI0025C478CB|nr:AAA family ATPase [Flavobacterium sp.]